MFDLLRPIFKWALIIAFILIILGYIFTFDAVFGALGHLWHEIGTGLHHAKVKARHG